VKPPAEDVAKPKARKSTKRKGREAVLMAPNRLICIALALLATVTTLFGMADLDQAQASALVSAYLVVQGLPANMQDIELNAPLRPARLGCRRFLRGEQEDRRHLGNRPLQTHLVSSPLGTSARHPTEEWSFSDRMAAIPCPQTNERQLRVELTATALGLPTG
jgi:hypothetical protein